MEQGIHTAYVRIGKRWSENEATKCHDPESVKVESDPEVGEPKNLGTRVHAYDAVASVLGSNAAIASLAAAVLARRLVLADPAPIPMPSTGGIKRQ